MTHLVWGAGPSALTLTFDEQHPVRASLAAPPDAPLPVSPNHVPAPRALVEILAVGHGRALTSTRCDRTLIGERMRLTDLDHSEEDGLDRLVVTQRDEVSGLEARSTFTRHLDAGSPDAWRTSTTLTNTSSTPVSIQMVSSLSLTGLVGYLGDPGSTELWTARSEWCAESRWSSQPVLGPHGLVDINAPLHGQAGRGSISYQGTSTWPSGEHLPVAALINRASGHSLVWQLEVNGPWRWELSTHLEPADLLTLLLHGPDDLHHGWMRTLAPGESLTSVPVSLAFSLTGTDDAVAALTAHRRASHLPTTADARRPLVFNDYMNALMGDPTTERLLPLIDAAASAGAERFCIDAGWYDEGGYWWDSVGEWMPSRTRFADGGLQAVLERIRSRGMEPGLWVEPEVIGVRSPLASTLPEDAFMHRGGTRIVEHERYLLDLRSPAARKHLDDTFRRLVEDYGVTYFKWDYNVTPGSGPDSAPDGSPCAPGDGLLEHARAQLSWLRDLRARYPHVILEACSSGAQRMDPATLSHYDLQSTSDQQDYRLYPPIAAAAPMSMAPEQAGNWAYPQEGMSLEQVAFTMVTGLSGRMYLSGRLDAMDEERMALVREATDLYASVIEHHAHAVPRWPLGLPEWDAPVVALVTSTPHEDLVFVWRRSTAAPCVTLPCPHLAGCEVEAEVLYPTSLPAWGLSWLERSGALAIDMQATGECARVIRLRH